jgi:hypothetical protein
MLIMRRTAVFSISPQIKNHNLAATGGVTPMASGCKTAGMPLNTVRQHPPKRQLSHVMGAVVCRALLKSQSQGLRKIIVKPMPQNRNPPRSLCIPSYDGMVCAEERSGSPEEPHCP